MLAAVFVFLAIICRAQDPHIAQEVFEMGNYFEAIEQYTRLIEKEPNNAIYNANLGMSYLRTNIAPTKALDYLLKVEQIGEHKDILYLEIAHAYTFHLQYDAAMLYLEKYRKAGKMKKDEELNYNRLKANCEAALDLMKYPVDVVFKNLGKEINSEYADYCPFLSNDGKFIAYTSRRKVRPGSRPEFDGYYPSDIYTSTFDKYEWNDAERLNDRINSIYDEQSVGITKSGDSLFFYIDHVDDFGDLFVTEVKGGVFSRPERIAGVNTDAIESACSVSHDGKTMIFSSNRAGGSGHLDIWMMHKDQNGQWGEAMNLGPEINTPFNEDFPTLSPDGRTLYFCSDGHPGMGGYDLFFSSWDEQSNIWTTPQNLGFPINGPEDDKNISFKNDGNEAVIAKLRDGGFGDLDIYEMSYQKEKLQGPAVFLINVQAEGKSASSKISIKNEYDNLVGRYEPNKFTGKYTIALYPGKYFLYIDAEGHMPYNEVLVVNDFHTRQDQNVKLIKLDE